MKNVYTLLAAQNQTAAGRKTLTSISKLILALIILVGMPGVGWGQIAQFNFPATNSLVVSVKDNNVAVSNFALSTGTIETNITTGSYFPNEPYIEETGGWTSSTQAGAKNFYFTITANTGYQFSITNISFRAYATSAGPSAFGFAIGSSDIYSVNAPDASIVAVSQTITGQSDLTTATIKIQGWLNGSRTSAGSGAFRLDDVIITGTVTSVGTPSITLSDNGTQITASDVNQATTAHILHKSALAVTTANATLTGMTCTTAGTYVAADITNLKVRYSTDNTLDAGDATLSTYTNPGAAGAKTFPSFTQQSISSGSTGYIFITADVAAGATHNNTISVDALATSNFTFSSGTKSGSTTAGGVQTFKDVTGPAVSNYSPSDGNTAVTINQDLILTFNENVQAGTSGNFVIYNSSGTEFESIPYNDARITFSSNTVTINPSGSFVIGAAYYVQIPATLIRDLAGNYYGGISNNTTWNFTTVAPSVTNVTSTNVDGTYKVGDLLTITVTFSASVIVTGTPQLQLETGSIDEQATYSTGSGSTVLTFLYTVLAGDISADLDYRNTSSLSLNSGSINSSGGIAALLALPSVGSVSSISGQKAIVIDGIAPTVSGYSPTDNNTSVTVNQNLTLTFTENVQAGTSGNFVIYNSNGTEFESIPFNDTRITFSSNTVTINPTGTFAIGAAYYVQIPATLIRDMAGNFYVGISNNTTWNFTTVAPSVTNVTSTNADATYKVGDLLTITVTFNDIVVVTGSPNLLLNMVGTDRQAAYSDGTGTNTLSFTHTIVATDGATDLDYVGTSSLNTNGGSINSLGGVAATRTLATPGTIGSLGFNKNIVVDGVAPTVNTYNPSDGNTSVAIDQSLILTFNENVKLGTSGSIVIYNAGGTVFETIPYNDGRITFSTNTVTINPTSLFSYSSDYYIQTTGSPITDMYDNVYAGINNPTTWNFATICGNVSVPYSQGFNSSTIPSCWTTQTIVGSSAIQYVASSTSPTTLPQEGTYYVYWNSFNYSVGTESRLISPGIVTTGIPSIDVSFYWMNENSASYNSGIYLNEGVLVQYSTDGTNWDAGTFYPRQDASLASGASEWKLKTLTLPIGAGNQAVIYISLKFHSEYGHNCSLDNIVINASPSCVVPTLVTSSSVASTTATISWTASVSSPTNGYQYEIRTSGAAGSGASGLTVSGTTSAGDVDAAITGLTDNTAFNVYVRSDCGSGDYSSWTTAYTFTTSGIEAPTANAASSVGSEGFTANWNTIDGADYYKIDVYTEIAGSNATDLFISEYVEGSASVEKYIEIYNGTGADVNLSNYKLQLFSNGNAIANEEITLSGTLVNASTVVYKNSASSAYSGASNVSNTVINFNGDDAVALRKITPAGYVDIFGRIGSDPGSAWTSTSNSTVDKTLVRKQTVSGGVTTNPSGTGPSAFTTLEAEWSQYNLEDITHLGSHTYSGATSQTFIVNNQTVNGISYTITGLNPNTVYKYRVRAVGINSTSTNSNVITVTTDFGTKVSTEAGDWNTITWNPAGVPTEDDNVTINHAVTLAGNADCNDLTIGTGSLTLASGASLITMGTVTGSATVKREITNNIWHFISAPNNNTKASSFMNDYLQTWSESAADWTDISDPETALVPGVGYGLWSVSGITESVFTGALNTGNVDFNVTLDATSGENKGANLLGNPYPCFIDWNGLQSELGSVYYWNGAAYVAYSAVNGLGGGSRYVPPMQGFFVIAPSTKTVTLTNANKAHSSPNYYKSAEGLSSNTLVLATMGESYSDKLFINFNPAATKDYDLLHDAYKLLAYTPGQSELYSIYSDTKLSIDVRPERETIQLGFRNDKSGTYQIGISDVADISVAYIEDTKTKTFHDLFTGPYSFNYTAGESEQRMLLHFGTTGTDGTETSPKTTIYANQQTVYVIMDENRVGDIYIYNLAGQLLAAKESATGQVTMGLSAAGVYLVKVITPTETITRKVVIR